MQSSLHGIHHITAISSDPQANIDFYTKTLGMRIVKLTVNYDDPGVYHLYFGDSHGSPGSILTFFPFPDAQAGKVGNGQVSAIGYSIAADSVGFWVERFARLGVKFDGPFRRFGEEVIAFSDGDGLPLELVADDNVSGQAWADSEIPARHQLRRFHSASLAVSTAGPTAKLLISTMGLTREANEGLRTRFALGQGESRQYVDIIEDPAARRGVPGPGTVHHIAWRCYDADEPAWREKIEHTGLHVTQIVDRNYFHSVYYREYAGILFEIATDEPGFTTDQGLSELGTKLVLPPWLETKRADIERRLPPVKILQPTNL